MRACHSLMCVEDSTMEHKDEEERQKDIQEYEWMDDHRRMRRMYFGIRNLRGEVNASLIFQGWQIIMLLVILIKVF